MLDEKHVLSFSRPKQAQITGLNTFWNNSNDRSKSTNLLAHFYPKLPISATFKAEFFEKNHHS